MCQSKRPIDNDPRADEPDFAQSMYLRDVADDPLARPGVTRAHLFVPEPALDHLRYRLETVRWPDHETVSDASQGLPLARAERLVEHWYTRYDWRRFETTLNDLGHYRTEIDGLKLHFLHVRSPHRDAMPVILTHGWPGSFVEFIRASGPLTNPTAHGGTAADAFHIVAPCMPGFGFSDKPTSTGWTVERIAGAWAELMQRLGYHYYIAQGGDWGGAVTHALAALGPDELAGIHLNFPPFLFDPPLDGRPSVDEQRSLDQLKAFQQDGAGYHRVQSTRPQTIGYGLTDSPVGLAAWIFEKFDEWTDTARHPERVIPLDMMLDNIMLYWLSRSGASSARLYWQNESLDPGRPFQVPVGISAFPAEIVRIPREWAQRAYPRLIYFNTVARGGHFAAFEQPALFARELRAFTRRLAQDQQSLAPKGSDVR